MHNNKDPEDEEQFGIPIWHKGKQGQNDHELIGLHLVSETDHVVGIL